MNAKAGIKRYAKVDGENHKRPQPYTKNCSQLRNAESGRSLPQRRVNQLVMQYQMVSPESTYMSDINTE